MPVLDASALLAYLRDEPGAATVAAALQAEGADIGAANWSQVLTKLSDLGLSPDEVLGRLERIGLVGDALRIRPVTAAHAAEAARLRSATRPAGLSLGDRLCLALARDLAEPVLTADTGWERVPGLVVEVRRIR